MSMVDHVARALQSRAERPVRGLSGLDGRAQPQAGACGRAHAGADGRELRAEARLPHARTNLLAFLVSACAC